MTNRMTENLSDGVNRERSFNGPAIETLNARYAQMGEFGKANVVASLVDAVLNRVFIGDAIVAGRSGRIVGLAVRSNEDLTAGSATFEPTIGGVKQEGSAVLSDLVQSVALSFAPVAFVKGALLGIMLSTDAGFLPVTADLYADLLIEWDPE